MVQRALDWESGVLCSPSSAAHRLCNFGRVLPSVARIPAPCSHPLCFLSSRRVDVLLMTPWFAPIIWDGTYDSAILNAQFKNTTIGVVVFAIKK